MTFTDCAEALRVTTAALSVIKEAADMTVVLVRGKDMGKTKPQTVYVGNQLTKEGCLSHLSDILSEQDSPTRSLEDDSVSSSMCRNEMGRGLAQRPEDLDGDGERGFDYLTFALVSSKAHREGYRASRGGFPYWLQRGGLRTGEEGSKGMGVPDDLGDGCSGLGGSDCGSCCCACYFAIFRICRPQAMPLAKPEVMPSPMPNAMPSPNPKAKTRLCLRKKQAKTQAIPSAKAKAKTQPKAKSSGKPLAKTKAKQPGKPSAKPKAKSQAKSSTNVRVLSKILGKLKRLKKRKVIGSPSIGKNLKVNEMLYRKLAKQKEKRKAAEDEKKAAKDEQKRRQKAAQAKAEKQNSIKKASKQKHVEETEDNEEDAEETNDVDDVFNKIQTMPFLNTYTRWKRKQAEKGNHKYTLLNVYEMREERKKEKEKRAT
ncbi:hypothetical protein Tco_0594215 [Tanacetum coccineum]